MNLPPLEEFIEKPTKIKIPEESDILFACIQMLSHNATVDNIEELGKFIKRLEKTPERQVQFWKSACSKNKALAMTPTIQDFLKDNQDLLL